MCIFNVSITAAFKLYCTAIAHHARQNKKGSPELVLILLLLSTQVYSVFLKYDFPQVICNPSLGWVGSVLSPSLGIPPITCLTLPYESWAY